MSNMVNSHLCENTRVLDNYKSTLITIKNIQKETKNCDDSSDKGNYYKYFNHVSNLIIDLMTLEKNLNEDYFNNNSIQDLMIENNKFYEELLPENYKTSFANPSYAVELLGDKLGQLFSALYVKIREYIDCVFKQKIYIIEKYNNLFIDMYNYIANNELVYDEILSIYKNYEVKNLEKDIELSLNEDMNKAFNFYTNLYQEDFTDLRYLFKFGKYVSINEIKTANYLLTYSDTKIEAIAETIANAYIRGFLVENKDITKRSVVRVACPLGYERIIKQLIKSFKSKNLDVLISEIYTTPINRQYEYDHMFNDALLLDQEYIKLYEESYKCAAEKCNGFFKNFSGDISVETFGEIPFLPESKYERLKFTESQMSLFENLQCQKQQILENYAPEKETSFCFISFPSPYIGENFEEIFENILKINMVDNEKHEEIQKTIIDALDEGEYVYIKGKGKNITDIKVKLHELKDTNKETNFANCGADVNLPLGEVFTSPVLKGTDGLLHIEDIYLDNFKYVHLKLTFTDGMITDYTCSNFEKEEDNKNYIKENLLFPHTSLPLGEFAIGTNTLAYVIAQKHNITEKLPILITEKMGPHFAIGDTCFSWREDLPIYNLIDKKEVIARDNEKSILRKENLELAYTYCHTDITLPYDSIEVISAIKKDGTAIDIIKNGRFVLEGTKELNLPFDDISI